MTQRTGGQVLVDQLVAQGCDRIFTVPGESFLAVLDALHDTPAIETVVCRQEGGVAFMAHIGGFVAGVVLVKMFAVGMGRPAARAV